jgi:uncharacterized protein YukE
MTKIYMRGGVYFGTAEDMIDRIEELEAKLAEMQRSRDRYREAWEEEKARFTKAMMEDRG